MIISISQNVSVHALKRLTNKEVLVWCIEQNNRRERKPNVLKKETHNFGNPDGEFHHSTILTVKILTKQSKI